MKNASHFAAWSSALLSHEEYRKGQVASGKALDGKAIGIEGGGASSRLRSGVTSVAGGDGINEWVQKTKKTIAGIKRGGQSL